MPRLRRSQVGGPGIRRLRRGRGFSYLDPQGDPLPAEEIERVRALAVPPAWRDVWICPWPHGHIQATGIDDAGRRQYLYHPAWHERMAQEKYDRMLQLTAVLPPARRGVTQDLRRDGFARERVLAGAFRMLDTGSLRVGSERYARLHGSAGLSTLLGAHATVRGHEQVELRFPGKSGQAWESTLDDPDLAALVEGLKRRGGRARLLAWRDDGGAWHPISASEINDEVRRRVGEEFTAKDFRTLHGTVTAAQSLAHAGDAATTRARQRAIADAVRQASVVLGNTPAIARASYVDPRLFDAFDAGRRVTLNGRSIESQLPELLLEE